MGSFNDLGTFLVFAITLVATLSVLGLDHRVDAQSEFVGKTMGPIDYRVVIHDTVENAAVVKTGIQEQLDQVDQLMSTYIDSSDVSRVNQSAAEKWVNVHALTLSVIKRSIELSKETDGAFDITVGPAVNAWKFGPDTDNATLPTDSDVAELQAYVGIEKIRIRPDPPSVQKLHDLTRIDLSAIAKGFAVDRVVTWLTEQSLANFMVEVGGEVAVRGKTPEGSWRIGIEKPVFASVRSVETVVTLENSALATSGDYRNFRTQSGKRISHTIDPKTCRPVETPPASCSIIAGDCMTADAIATAVMVMGGQKGLGFCESQPLQAYIVSRLPDRQNQFASTKTSGFPIEANLVSQATSSDRASIWPTFIGAMVVFSLAVAGMAIGAIFNDRPIKGSCGGIGSSQNEDGSSACSLCNEPTSECPEPRDISEHRS